MSHVVVVGGGVIGCAVAERLSRDGHRVTLLERDRVGAHASGAAAGLLAPYSEADSAGPFFELAIEGLSLFPELSARLEAETGMAVEFRSQESLRLAFDPEELARLKVRAAWQAGTGLATRMLDAAEYHRAEPGLGPEVIGAAAFPEAQVTPIRLVRALARAAAARGTLIREGTPVLGLISSGGEVLGVQLLGERIAADLVVLAAGPWSPQVAAGIGLEIPVRPRRGQLVALRPVGSTPGRILTFGHLYLVPKPDGTLVCGSTEEEAGFDAVVTLAGAEALLGSARRAVPSLGSALVERFWAGLRPVPADGLPLVGPAGGHPNLILATGHNRNGILLAPVAAETVARQIGGGHG